MTPSFLEFFAGGGMVRAGLQSRGWRCVFANDIDPKKGAVYSANWGHSELVVGDISKLSTQNLPTADLAWASFPCQDLSLAGNRKGLAGSRSGTFFDFFSHVLALKKDGRAPSLIALENVRGTITANQGADFGAICRAFDDAGYIAGAVVVDGALFVPQSRPRVFFVGVRNDLPMPTHLVAASPLPTFHPRTLRSAVASLSAKSRKNWRWWNLPVPPPRKQTFTEIIEEEPTGGVEWHSSAETARLISMMSPIHLAKLRAAQAQGQRVVGGVYKRTRPDGTGGKVQRAEVRFDDVAGCLRTPSGGSSRQTIILVEGETVRSRLISPRETARLMGLSDSYRLPVRYNDAYHVTGDGVVVPAIGFLAQNLFEPILDTTLFPEHRQYPNTATQMVFPLAHEEQPSYSAALT